MSLTRELVEDFYRAFLSRDPERVASFLDDDVDWMIAGPVDVLRHCGRRKGKTAAVELITQIQPKILELKNFEFDDILIAGDRAATSAWLVGIEHMSGHAVKFRCAHFLRFRDGKVVSFRTVSDTFSFVEQILGHPLDLAAPAQEQAA